MIKANWTSKLRTFSSYLLGGNVLSLFLAASVGIAQAAHHANDSKVVEYINGIIWTGTSGQNYQASIMVTEGNKISYVGNQRPAKLVADTVVDLKGGFVIPGLIDNHVHFIEGGAGLAAVQLRDAKTKKEFISRIAVQAKSLSAGQWVLYGNWDHESWGGELPEKEWIDEQTGDTPVFVMRIDGHMGFVNSAALKLAGITRDSKQPAGGEIVFNEDGEPTGVLKDTALDPILAVLPSPTDEELLKAVDAAQRHALSLGLTQVHVMTASANESDAYRPFVLADQKGLLRLRTIVYTPIQQWQDVLADKSNKGSIYNYSSDLLRWGGFKGLTDGALGSTTAWFYDPYLDAPDKTGFPLIDQKDLEIMLSDSDATSVDVAIHAIGDRAIDAVIEAMQNVAGDNIANKRYRIEHFQHPSKAAIEALAAHKIVASMQPYHAIDDGRWAEKRIGAERILTTYAFKTILDDGGILSFGSDWPVAPLAPLKGIYAAVTRQTIDGANPDGWMPQEKISVDQALRAYTASNAYAVNEDSIGGTLESGKRADFVVLDQDLRTMPAEDIADATVRMTVLNGVVEYQASK